MFDSVLVPTDGSECADVAVGYATDLATRYDATVHVLSIADARTLDNADHREAVEAESSEVVREVHERVADVAVPVADAVRTGVPHEQILEYAEEEGIDLIVMGTHGRTGVERFLLGSVTEKVVRLSPVPVLTVHGEDDGDATYPYEDVLLPTDGSDHAAAAIPVGVDIASTYDATLHALSVIDLTALGVNVQSADYIDDIQRRGQEAVDAVADAAAEASLSGVETTVQYGHTHSAIHDYVDEHDVDLIVMGTHGRTGVGRYLLGSVTEKVVRTSSVPVLTVRERSDRSGAVDEE